MIPILLGNLGNGLYYLTGDTKCFISNFNNEEPVAGVASVDNKTQDKIKLWHLRMGHLPVSLLHHLPDLFNKPCNLSNICQMCPVEK